MTGLLTPNFVRFSKPFLAISSVEYLRHGLLIHRAALLAGPVSFFFSSLAPLQLGTFYFTKLLEFSMGRDFRGCKGVR